jgi:hypothetical protein
MSELLLNRFDLSPWEPTEFFPGDVPSVGRAVPVAVPEALPAVRPGQLWYVELPPTGPAHWPLEYQALTTANVVIYDRTLEPTVAGYLPLGAYAEPATPGDKVTGRCLGFAREGWSVARLLGHRGKRVDIIRQLSQGMLGVGAPATIAASIFVNTHGSYKNIEVELGGLSEVIDAYSLEPAATLTVIFKGVGDGSVPRLAFASSNGLAG